ncbi:MAG TPA: sialidase family protein, partial [Ferruginibacter sp.]|nr:sialidase family protein [Ferruginibacter sp.]
MQTFQPQFRKLLLLAVCAAFFLTGCFEKINPGTETENDMYDGPDKAMKQEFDMTKDPATGRVPIERLLLAKEQTLAMRASSFSNTPNALTPLTWIERGPNSDVVGPSNGNTRANAGVTAGRVRALCVDSADATHKTVWVAGVDGGIWKTTDITTSPANWVLINDQMTNLAVSAICQDPTNNNTMYACTGESYFNADAVSGVGVFKSMDHGVTWNFLASTNTFTNSTRILCDNAGRVYLAGRSFGVRRSSDGGGTWTNITPATAQSSDICDMELSNTGRLHIVTGIFSTQSYFYANSPSTV